MKWNIAEDILLAIGMCLFILLLFAAILDAVYPNGDDAIERGVEAREFHLPSKCKEYYNTGTDEWQRCMLVEKR